MQEKRRGVREAGTAPVAAGFHFAERVHRGAELYAGSGESRGGAAAVKEMWGCHVERAGSVYQSPGCLVSKAMRSREAPCWRQVCCTEERSRGVMR